MPARRRKYRVPIVDMQRVIVELPFSEVCMHMRVAGTEMIAELRAPEGGYPGVQLFTLDGQMFSSTITTGEAGVFTNSDGTHYTYTTRKPAGEFNEVATDVFAPADEAVAV